MLALDDSRWLSISPSGFFAGTRGGSELASIVRGLDVTSPEQMYQSLFAPDLIRERLAGDPDGEFKAAADVLNLRTVLDSGRVPQVALVSPTAGANAGNEIVTAQARIADTGGGIGRIEWRVNGVTAAVTKIAAEGGTERVVSQALALEPGDNTVEVVAYNARNWLASLPAITTVRWTAPANQPQPKLYVIAVGIDKYEDAVFRRLSLAVADARAFGAAMKTAGAGLYADVDVTYVLDTDATAAELERAIAGVGARMHPRDAFIFFAAAHGKSEDGRFHLIPQGLSFCAGTAVERRHDRTGTAAGLVCQPHPGTPRRHPARHLRERCAGRRPRQRRRSGEFRSRARSAQRGDRPAGPDSGGGRPGRARGLQGPRRVHIRAARCADQR
jgi:hypothetical protein